MNTSLIPHYSSLLNKSVENAGVTFVKGANEGNEFFEKTNSNLWQTSPDKQGKGLTVSGTKWFGDQLCQVTKAGVSLRQ